MPNSQPTILYAGGGTGGHISPLLAVMEAVHKEKPKINLAYVGLAADLDSPLIQQSQIPFQKYSIRSGKLHRHLTTDHIRQFSELVRGLGEANKLIRKLQPDVVMCKGSMLSVPIALAAWRRGIPIYSHETDVVSGLANRIISRLATGIFTTYPVSNYRGIPQSKLIYTGQPVRPEFYHPDKKAEIRIGNRVLEMGRPLITVTGGSQGARRINQLMVGAWGQLLIENTVVHICGARDYEKLQKAREPLPDRLRKHLYLIDFQANQVAELFDRSSLLISRAGGTIGELAATSCATILLPLPTAAQNHQWENARVLQASQAAVVLDETTITSDQLAKTALAIMHDPHEQARLKKAIHQFDRPQAAQQMAERLFAALEQSQKIG